MRIYLLLFSLLAFQSSFAQEFSSVYTNFDENNCESFDNENGGDGYMVCAMKFGYELNVSYDFYGNEFMRLSNEAEAFETALAVDNCGTTQQYGGAIEWRLADGKPFAVILRFKCMAEDQNGNPTLQRAEFLMVRGLAGYEAISKNVNVGTGKDANTAARGMADEAFQLLQNQE